MSCTGLILSAGMILTALTGCVAPRFEREPVDPGDYINPVEYADHSATHPRAAEYDEFLDTFDSPFHYVPGMAILLGDPDHGDWAAVRGELDLEFHIPWRKNSLGKIGSISKTFGSVICLKMQEQGLLDLDRPLAEYLNETIIRGVPNADRATVRQILNHTSGIPDHLAHPQWLNKVLYSENRLTSTLEEALDNAREMEADFAPGEGFVYSNTNYVLVQYLIEEVSGLTVQEAVVRYITRPLGMASTYLPYEVDVPAGVARSYHDYGGFGVVTDITPIELAGNFLEGGIVSTVYDMATFFRAIAFDDEFISPESRRQMMVKGHPDSTILSKSMPGIDDAEGLGITVLPHNGKTFLANSGGCLGHTSYVAVCLETGETFALLVNGQGGKVGWTVFNGILKGVLEKFAR